MQLDIAEIYVQFEAKSGVHHFFVISHEITRFLFGTIEKGKIL